MTWSDYHKRSENYAIAAHEARINKELSLAHSLFVKAGQMELKALECLVAKDKPRTFSVSAVSAASLFYKGGDFKRAEAIAYKALANDSLLGFAEDQLREIIQKIPDEKNLYDVFDVEEMLDQLRNETGFTLARQISSDDGFTNSYKIPDSLGEFRKRIQAETAKEIQAFLSTVERHTKCRVCSLFLIDDDGSLKSQGFCGVDREKNKISKDSYFANEQFPDDFNASAVARAIKPDNSLIYGKSLLLVQGDIEEEVFVKQEYRKIVEDICGDISYAVLTPVNGPNRSYGVIRLIRAVECRSEGSSFGPDPHDVRLYLHGAASILAQNLREINSTQKLMLMSYMNRANLGIHGRECSSSSNHSGIRAYLQDIIEHLAQSQESCIVAATLRIFSKSKNGLVTVASSAKEERFDKDKEIRRVEKNEKRKPLVIRVYEDGIDCTILDLQREVKLGSESKYHLINVEWLEDCRIKSLLCLAIKISGNTVGTLTLYAGQKQVIADKDRIHYRAIADNLSLFLASSFSHEPDVEAALDKFLDAYSPSPGESVDVSLPRSHGSSGMKELRDSSVQQGRQV